MKDTGSTHIAFNRVWDTCENTVLVTNGLGFRVYQPMTYGIKPELYTTRDGQMCAFECWWLMARDGNERVGLGLCCENVNYHHRDNVYPVEMEE
ncbi:hypothetical protein AMR41_14315 [Hapalosiphon sp. MRB220]|nr:hypothetical protein AMR41_14315 [Hapalosiphon sp. MRB220]